MEKVRKGEGGGCENDMKQPLQVGELALVVDMRRVACQRISIFRSAEGRSVCTGPFQSQST